MTENFANFAKDTLNGNITSGATSLIVNSAALFPAAPFRIVVDTEIMLVTAKSGTTFTVTRAQEGTTAASHTSGVQVANNFTVAILASLQNSGASNDILYSDGAGGFLSNADFYFDAPGGINVLHVDGFGGGGGSAMQYANVGGSFRVGHDYNNNGSNDYYVYNATLSELALGIDDDDNWTINNVNYIDHSGLLGINTTAPTASGDFRTFTFTASDAGFNSLSFDFTGSGYTPDADGTTITRTIYENSTHGGVTVYGASPPSLTLLEYFNPSALSTAEQTGLGNYVCNGQTINYTAYAIYDIATLPGKTGPGIATSFSDTINDGVTTFQVNLTWATPDANGGPLPDAIVIANDQGFFTVITPSTNTVSDLGGGSWSAGSVSSGSPSFTSLSFDLSIVLTPGAASDGLKISGQYPNGLNYNFSFSPTNAGSTQTVDDNGAWGGDDIFTPTSPYTTPGINTDGNANIGGNINLVGYLLGGSIQPTEYYYPDGVPLADTANLYTYNHALQDYFGSAPGNNLVLGSNFGRQSWGVCNIAMGGTAISSYTLGDIIYASGSATLTKLAGNTTIVRKFLRQVGNGSASAAPVWDTLVAGDLPVITALGLVATYGPWTLAGVGLSPTVAAAVFATQSATKTLTTVTTPAGANSVFRIGGWIEVVSISVDVIQFQVAFTDNRGNPRTIAVPPIGATSPGITVSGFYPMPAFDIRCTLSTSITVSATLTTGTGSITFDAGTSIQQIA